MGELIYFRPNNLGYRHVVCNHCQGNKFHIATTDDNKFYSIICTECENEIFCNLQPVYGPDKES
jgi:hypothetical protein